MDYALSSAFWLGFYASLFWSKPWDMMNDYVMAQMEAYTENK